MLDWLGDHQGVAWTVAVASAVVFVASLLIIPALVVRIRPNYFAHDRRPPSLWDNQPPTVRIALLVGKNLLGAVLILAGIAMLVLPGQGLLTMLIGFLLVSFPGKYRLEKWLVARRCILRPLNWLRRRAGREPLQVKVPALS